MDSSSLCVLRSKVQECHDGFDGIAKFVDESFFQVCRGVRSQRELMRNLISPQQRCFSLLDVETIDQLLTLEVLCQRAQWIMRRQFRQRKSITRMNLESVLGESLQHYGIKGNVPFTNRSGSTMNVNFEVTDIKTCNFVCAQKLRQRLEDRVHSRWKG